MKMHYIELEYKLKDLGDKVYLDYDNTLDVEFDEDGVFPVVSDYVVLSDKEGQLIKFHVRDDEDIDIEDRFFHIGYKEEVISLIGECVNGKTEQEYVYTLESLYGQEGGIFTITYVDDNIFNITFEDEIEEYEEFDGYVTSYSKSVFTETEVGKLPYDIKQIIGACMPSQLDKE